MTRTVWHLCEWMSIELNGMVLPFPYCSVIFECKLNLLHLGNRESIKIMKDYFKTNYHLTKKIIVIKRKILCHWNSIQYLTHVKECIATKKKNFIHFLDKCYFLKILPHIFVNSVIKPLTMYCSFSIYCSFCY